MPKTAGGPRCIVKIFGQLYFGPYRLFYDHLRYPVPPFYPERLTPVIYYDQADEPAIIGIDGTRRIDKAHAMPQCQAAARTYLGFISFGNTQIKTRRNQPDLAWPYYDLSVNIGRKVHAARAAGRVLRYGDVVATFFPFERYLYGFQFFDRKIDPHPASRISRVMAGERPFLRVQKLPSSAPRTILAFGFTFFGFPVRIGLFLG